jgi:hypothetical protein
MISSIRTACFFMALLVGMASSLAYAADSPTAQADALITAGFKLRLQGKNTEALDLFLKAHAIAPSAKTLAQIGSLEVALRRWVEAESHLDQGLARHDSPWIEVPKNRELIERTLVEARQQIGRVQVRGTAGASVTIGGHPVGTLPLAAPVHVAAGSVHVEVAETGFRPAQRDLAVQGGTEQTVDFALVPMATPPAQPATVNLAQSSPTESRRPAWRTWTGGGLMVAGLASVGVGIGWLVVDGRPMCDAPSGGVCKYLYDTKTQGWVAIGLGAAVVAGGATVLLWPSRRERVGVAIAPGSVALTGQF